MASASSRSPYELVLAERFAGLHPRLAAYFGLIRPGWEGVGSGIFDSVGTPRRWLWPILAILQRQGVLFPVWEKNVPFTVLNRPADGGDGGDNGHGHGSVSVSATRTFRLPGRDRQMVDAITAEGAALVDYLGLARRYRVQLTASVQSGRLVMRSTGMAVRFGNTWLGVPRLITPKVTLTERFDDVSGRQHVEVVTTLPGLGRVYEYSGLFDYELQPCDGGAT